MWSTFQGIRKRTGDVLLLALCFALRLRRFLTRGNRAGESVLILPPAPQGSLGDEALVRGAMRGLRDQGIPRIGLLGYGDQELGGLSGVDERIALRGLFDDSLGPSMRFALQASRYDSFLVLGADVVDGAYSPRRSVYRLNLCRLAALTGAECRVIGFSMNASPAPEAVEAFRALPDAVALYPRDPNSLRRLEQSAGRPAQLCADPAFLLEPKSGAAVDRASAWIDRQRAEGRTILGLNANKHALPKDGRAGVEDLIGAYVAALVDCAD
ncbi:MAG: polysaccharide pyruvyl transferase family protein, partial [Planctomycetales bacterium]